MAREASKCLFLLLLFIFLVSSSGTLVGFIYDARKSDAVILSTKEISPSVIRIIVGDQTVLPSMSNVSVSVSLYLNKTVVEDLKSRKVPAVSWLKTHLTTNLPFLNIKNIIVSGEENFPMLLSTLRSLHSLLGSFHLAKEVKVSVAFPLSFLEDSISRGHERYLQKAFHFINEATSFVIVEADIEGELSMGDQFVQLVIQRTTLAASLLANTDVPMMMAIKTSAVPSATEVAKFKSKILRYMENSSVMRRIIIGLFADASPSQDFEQKQLEVEEEQKFSTFDRELLSSFPKAIEHDAIDPPITFSTTLVTNPVTTPVTLPLDNPTPTIVTVPSTNPVAPNPDSTPVTLPSAKPLPMPLPNTTPVNPPTPVTNPVTTPTNPVTTPIGTNPPASGGVPVATPTSNPPAVAGQSWCVVKSGAPETAVQSALDYACGIGGADCSAVQQSGSCYNPNTLQNHASYAFNSYYQKNPVQTSCDFGGTATITITNPSSGSCIYPSTASASSSTPATTSPTPTIVSPTPTTTSPTPTTVYPTPTTSSSSGAALPVPGTLSPPAILNASNPASGTSTDGFGDSPPAASGSAFKSYSLQPFIYYIILVISIITGVFVFDV